MLELIDFTIDFLIIGKEIVSDEFFWLITLHTTFW